MDIALKKMQRQLIENNLGDCQEGLNFLKIKISQFKFVGSWMKDESKIRFQEMRKQSAIIHRALKERRQ